MCFHSLALPLQGGSLPLMLLRLGNAGFSRCLCFSDTLLYGAAFCLHSSRCSFRLWQVSKTHCSPFVGRLSIPMMFGEPMGLFCLYTGKLFSKGSVRDSEVMVCSLALEQPVLEMSLTSACSGPSTRQSWTHLLSSLDPVAHTLAQFRHCRMFLITIV